MKNSLHAKKNFVCGWICLQIVLKPRLSLGDSKSGLRFGIEQWEVGYFCAHTVRTDRKTDKVKFTHTKNFFICSWISAQMFLKPSPWPGDFKSVLKIKIGYWKVG